MKQNQVSPLLVGGLVLVLGLGVFVKVGYGQERPPVYATVAPVTVSALDVPPTVAALQSIPVTPLNMGLPARLRIPTLGVDASVQYMGLTKEGNMDVPASITDVGWYKLGANPGSPGTAVIAGHLDGIRGEPGVFSALDKLKVGDTFSVLDAAGASVSFAVRRTKVYSQDAHPEEVFTSASGTHLNLITCTGSWDAGISKYAQRLVVFADRID
jgi:LPXTG-site transpeptidase (sortase) family protein